MVEMKQPWSILATCSMHFHDYTILTIVTFFIALMALDIRNHYMHVENLFEAEMLEPQLMALHLRDLGTPRDFWVWSLASQTW